MEKFQDKYRIPSSRAAFWNYGWSAAYFVTICTKNRICFFGQVTDGKMELSEIGQIVKSEWLKTFEIRPDMNLDMGEYIIMPNHFHAIIGIGDNQYNTQRDTQRGIQRDIQRDIQRRDAMHCVSTHNTHNTHNINNTHNTHNTTNTNDTNETNENYKNQFGPQSKNLASVIRGFKIGVTKNARLINPDFAWQPRYHDHIIRNDQSYQTISEYIINNPLKWSDDKFYM